MYQAPGEQKKMKTKLFLTKGMEKQITTVQHSNGWARSKVELGGLVQRRWSPQEDFLEEAAPCRRMRRRQMDQVGGLGRGGGKCRVMRRGGPPGEHSWGHRAEKFQRLVHRQGERRADKGQPYRRKGGLQSTGFSLPTWFHEKPSSEHLGTHSEWGLCLRNGGNSATGLTMRNLRTLCSMR